MDRQQVYSAIDGERDYQNEKWGGLAHDTEHGVAAFLTYIRHYLARTEERATMAVGVVPALNELRKVVALGVACLEIHGCPRREGH